jgi:hypothetical protein
MVKWKLLIRKVTLKWRAGGWETPPDKEEGGVQAAVTGSKELREMCLRPLEGQFINPMLMVFGDR